MTDSPKLDVNDVIETVYDAVLDRARFDELVDLATHVLENDAAKARFHELKEVLERHVNRAEIMLHNLPPDRATRDHVPAFDLMADGTISACNALAMDLLDIRHGMAIADMDLSDDITRSLKAFMAGEQMVTPVLRLKRQDSGKPYLLFADSRQQGEPDRPPVFPITFMGADRVWTERAATAFQAIFALTPSETTILGHLMAGLAPADIAALRSRSIETVRQQIKTVTRKTGSSGMQELLHLGRAITQSTRHGTLQDHGLPSRVARRELRLPDGRIMDYTLQGAAEGEAEELVIFLHGCLCGNLLPLAARDYLSENRITLVAPARPGHGRSTMHEHVITDPASYGEDLKALMAHMQADKVHLVGFDIGAIIALCLAGRLGDQLGDRLKSLTCLSAHPPVEGMRDIAAMPAQQRIFTIMPKLSLPLLRFLAKTGDRRLRQDGMQAFPATVFKGAPADLRACEDASLLTLFWQGHLFHVENGSDGFIADCRIAASDWSNGLDKSPVPVTFIHGAENATIPLRRIQRFTNTLEADLHIVPHAGHTLPFSHWRETFASIIGRQDGGPSCMGT